MHGTIRQGDKQLQQRIRGRRKQHHGWITHDGGILRTGQFEFHGFRHVLRLGRVKIHLLGNISNMNVHACYAGTERTIILLFQYYLQTGGNPCKRSRQILRSNMYRFYRINQIIHGHISPVSIGTQAKIEFCQISSIR